MSMLEKAWIDIGGLDDIPKLGARLVKTPAGCIAVFRTDTDEVFALDDKCPHKGGPLSQGIVHGKSVTCPLHNWVLSLESGKAQGADVGQVPTYRLKIEAGRILIDGSTVLGARS
ncbi:MAG: nitrite reductase small subunit NirD [Proteobacteria bacterium]|nr:nitrite reductase small subunit NirD [Pseudomonadota bacterium]